MAARTTARREHRSQGDSSPRVRARAHPAHLRYRRRAALPDSTRRLAAVLMHQDSDVSIVDVRAVLRALADGIDHTVYVLDRGHHEAAEVTRATRLLREAKTPITGSSPPDRRCPHADTDAHGRPADGPRDRRPATGRRRTGSRRRPPRRAAPTHLGSGRRALRWAAETPLVTDAIDRSLHAAVRAGRVAVRRTGEVQWVIASSDPDSSHAHALLQAATNARRALAAAHPALVAAANHLSHPSANAVRDAARRAGAGRAQLAEALAGRRSRGNLAGGPRPPATPCWPLAHRRNAAPRRQLEGSTTDASTPAARVTAALAVAVAGACRLPPCKSRERARRLCMETLLPRLRQLAVSRVWLKSRTQTLNKADQRGPCAKGGALLSSTLRAARLLEEPML